MLSELDSQFNTFLQLVKENEVLLDNLVPICERAIEVKNKEIALKCLEYFFSKEGPKSQYIYRAYNCRALLSVPQSIFDYDGILEMGDLFIKAVEIDKSYKMYHFLVFNVSVDFMECSRPFLCQETRKFLLKPLQSISKALEDCEETDLEWRVQIMRQLVLSLHESNKKEESAKLATVLLELSKKVSKELLRESQIFISSNQISELKEHKFPNEILIIAKANRLKWYLLNNISLSFSDLSSFLRLLTTCDIKDKPIFEQTHLFSFLPLEIRDLDISLKSVILVLVGTVSLLNGHLGLADECIFELQQLSPFDTQTEFLYTFLILSLQAKKISDKIHSKSGLKRYTELLLGMVRQIHSAEISQNIEAIEIGASIIWHFSLVLCQPNSRKYIKRSLFDISRILDRIGSQLYTLRSFIYRELAQCDEQDEEIELALQHLELSVKFNNGEQWVIAQKSEMSRLKLKKQIYIKPEDTLERAVQMLDQVKSITEAQTCREILFEIGENIIGYSLSPFLDSHLNSNFTTYLHEESEIILDYLEQCVNLFIESCKRTHLDQYIPENDKMRCHLLFELSKISRKMEIWDICRCASRLCLSYNDGRWGSLPAIENFSQPPDKVSLNSAVQSLVASKASITSEQTSDSQPNIKERDTKILHIFAEAQYILAEGSMELILKNKLTLYETPNVLNFNLKLMHKDDQRWKNFCFWINKLSDNAVTGFVSAVKWATDLGQNWLVSNCLASFWNYTKHLTVLKKEYSILQPLRDINLITNSKVEIRPRQIVYKLSMALINALIHESQHRMPTVSAPPATPLKMPTSRIDRERKKNLGTSPSISPETNLNMESIQLLKEANEVCDKNFLLLAHSLSDVETFQSLVRIWVKIQTRLNQPITLDKIIEPFNNSKESNIMKAIVVIEVLLTANSNIITSEITISSASENLVTSNAKSSIITLELWSKLAQISLNAKQHDIVTSCVEHGRINGTMLIDPNLKCDPKNKVYLFLSKLESTLALSWYDSSLYTTSNELLGQIITACIYADKAHNFQFVVYNLKLFWNLCKPMHKEPKLTCFLTEKAHIILTILSNYSKIHALFRINDTIHKDIKIELFTLFMDAFSNQCSWDNGLDFLELALIQVHKESHLYFVRYIILFKAKLNINVTMDISHFAEEMRQIDQSNLYLLAAHASTDRKNKFDYYQGAINSLNDREQALLRINIKLEFFQWLVMIKVSHELLISLLEEVLGELVECITERLTCQKRNEGDLMVNIELGNINIFSSIILESFEEWTLSEIDCFFQILMLIVILHGRSFYQKYQTYLQIIVFCIYSMLKLAFVQNTESKIIIYDQGKKGKGATKPKTDSNIPYTFLPNSLDEWSRYFPARGNLTLSACNQSTLLEDSLISHNMTLYYLNHLNKELKISVFSHFQLLPLALMNAISLACDNCPRGWSKLSYLGLLDYAKRFNIESSVEFWKNKLDGNYFSQEDHSFLQENIIIDLDQGLNHHSISVLPTTSLFFEENGGHLITFHKKDFIILIVLEISNVLLELEHLQAVIDIVSECETFLKVFPATVFDCQIYDLKVRTHHAVYVEQIGQKIYNVLLHHSLTPTNVFLESSLSLSKLLEYAFALQFLENVIQVIRNYQTETGSGYYTYIRVSFEIELATRQLNFYLSNSSTDTNGNREIIDVDISLELLYSCFCILNASQNFIYSMYALKKYIHFLDKLRMTKDYMFSGTSYFKFVNKSLSCYKIFIDLNKELIANIISVSLHFDVDLVEDTSIHFGLVDSHLSFASFGISIFQMFTELRNTEYLKVNMYSQTEKVIDKYIKKEISSSKISGHLITNIISLITDSITTLAYLQTISSCHLIELELGRAMISLYHFHGQNILEREHCIMNYTDPLMSQLHITELEYKENEYSHSRSIRYFASGVRYLQKYLLKYIGCDTTYLDTLKDICYRFLTLIGVYDRRQSTHYLALYQSISCSSFFKSIISQLLKYHFDSKLAALKLFEHNFPLESHYFRLNILSDFFEFTKEMPSYYRYLILQHSQDMSTLYFAYTQQPPSAKANKGLIPPTDWLPIFGQYKVNPDTLQEIIQMLEYTSEPTRLSYYKKFGSAKDRENTPYENIFKDITAAIRAYFNCIIPVIEPIIRNESNPQDLILFILCDESILSLPIEIISNFAPLNIFGQISRDFSLQILNHRFKSIQSFQNKECPKDKSKDSVPPINSEVDHDFFDISSTRYYIDPYDSFASPSNANDEIQTMLRKSFASYQKLTNKWNGMIGTSSSQTLHEKWNVFKADNMLLLLPGLFTFHYPLDKIISPSYTKRYNLILLFDKIFCDYSNCHIFKDHCLPIEVYSSIVISGLLSIIGGNVIVTNVWPVNSYLISKNLICFFNYLFKEGYTISKAIQCINNLKVPHEEIETAEQEYSTHLPFGIITYGLSYMHSM